MTSYLITLGPNDVFLTFVYIYFQNGLWYCHKTWYMNNIYKKLQLSKYFVTSYLVTLSLNNVFLTFFYIYFQNGLWYCHKTWYEQHFIKNSNFLNIL